ncbi:hypothetical protein PQX77_000973, partial [Marasmius sp. AFHP31]
MVDISAAAIALEHQKTVSYINVATSALLVYDVALNLESELWHIWRKEWSLVKVLYVTQRYLPFLDTVGVLLYFHFGENLSPQHCDIAYRFIGWSFITGLVLSE